MGLFSEVFRKVADVTESVLSPLYFFLMILEGRFNTIVLSLDLLFHHILKDTSVVNLIVLFLFQRAKKNLHTRYKSEAYTIIFIEQLFFRKLVSCDDGK